MAADLVALYEWLPKSIENQWFATTLLTEQEYLVGHLDCDRIFGPYSLSRALVNVNKEF